MMQSESNCQRITHNTGVGITNGSSYQRRHSFNDIDRLAAQHDVTVSNTMIKVTYSKGLKDHSVTSLSGNASGVKRHSVGCKPTLPEQCSKQAQQNHRKCIDAIVLIPNIVSVTKSNGADIKGKTNSKYPVTDENKHCKVVKKPVVKNDNSVINGDFSVKNLKQLKVSLLRIDAMDAKQASINHMDDDHENGKIVMKHNGSQILSENKSIVSVSPEIEIIEEIVKVDNLQKDKLKLNKGKDENFKKKRLSTEEIVYQHKKFKSNHDGPGKQVKMKLNLGSIKEKKVNVNQGEKKTQIKVLDTSQDGSKVIKRRELMRHDPSLPPGWRRIIKEKCQGNEFRPVICIVSPEGRKFYFKARLKEYLEKTNSNLNADDFHFGLYEKSFYKYSETNSKVNKQDKKNVPKKVQKKNLKDDSSPQERKKMKISDPYTMKDKKIFTEALKLQEVTQEQKLIESPAIGQKNILLVDPDLPNGWVRKIRIRNDIEGPDKFQVYIISPEGRKFKRKYILERYLRKTQSGLDISQFYFGLYPKRYGSGVTASPKEIDPSQEDEKNKPMYEDRNLPQGWRRCIKVRTAGESAGKKEVFIVSADGRKHRSKKVLAKYIRQQGLDLKAEDFDFSVFGNHSKKYQSQLAAAQNKQSKEGQIVKKRDSLPVPSDTSFANLSLDNSSVPDTTQMPREALMINYVGGLMLHCGLRDLRTERRLRNPKETQEKLKKYLEENDENTEGENEISSRWIQKLALCRGDFGNLEPDAAETIAAQTTKFLQNFTRRAFESSSSGSCLEYADLAEFVDKTECLSPLKELIPKKINFREFLILNRPTKFSSF